MKHLTKPVDVETFLWNGEVDGAEFPEWLKKKIDEEEVVFEYFDREKKKAANMRIQQGDELGAEVAFMRGDYIVYNPISGMILPFPPDIFDELFMRIEAVEVNIVDDAEQVDTDATGGPGIRILRSHKESRSCSTCAFVGAECEKCNVVLSNWKKREEICDGRLEI